MSTRAIAYLRVSTEKQSSEGVSLEAQRRQVEAYASLYGIELVAVIVETGSASTMARPGLQDALARLASGEAQALLVTKLDRLTRSIRDLGDMIETAFGKGGASLMSVGEQIDTRTAAGRMVLNVLMSVSQWEREAIGERTSVAMQHKLAAGEYVGGKVPFGKRVDADGRLVADDAETAVAEKARALRATGLSLRDVAAALGPVSRTGGVLAAAQVARMIAVAA